MVCRFLTAVVFVGLGLLAGCREGTPPPLPPPTRGEREALVEILRREYLWADLLPGRVCVADYASSEALLEDLLARPRVRGLDRWSALTGKAAPEQVSALGNPAYGGYGALFGFLDGKVVVLDAVPGSGATLDGLGRGDEILALGPSRAALDLKEWHWTGLMDREQLVPVLTALATASPQAPAWLRTRSRGAALPRDIQCLPPAASFGNVPEFAVSRVIEHSGRKVGHLLLRTFSDPVRAQLPAAMEHLRQAGVTDLIVDLRYNQGGLLEVTRLFLDHLNPGHLTGQVQFLTRRRPGDQEWSCAFRAAPGAIRPGRIAFLTSALSASASEAVINALQPYYGRDLAMVGRTTHGKPVVTTTFPLASGRALNLVIARILNAEGRGDYFKGLPDAFFRGTFLPAPDDLGHDLGDPREACTASALAWILGESAPSLWGLPGRVEAVPGSPGAAP
jgi:C-terminal processing protease CtpA/Prc